MKQRFGAILCLLLGTVLVVNGLGGTSDATAGSTVPSCSIAAPGTPSPICPVGSIDFTETTVGGLVDPGTWTVTITSTCNNPSTGTPVNMTVAVPNNGSKTSLPLFVYTDESSTTSCSYSYVEAVNPNYSPAFAPAAPQPIVYNVEGSQLHVDITNTFVPATSTSRAPSSSTPSPSVIIDSTTAPPSASDSASASAIQLSNTGPRSPVRATLWIGIAVLFLGFGMLFLGRRPQGSRVRK